MIMKKTNIENNLKEKFDTFESDVDSKVWENIQNALTPAKKANKVVLNVSVAIVSIIATAVTTIAIMNAITPEEMEQKNEVQSIVVAPKQLTQKEIKDFSKNEESVIPAKKTDAAEILKPEKIAAIEVDYLSGTIPLEVNFKNKGKGKNNHWIFNNKKSNKKNQTHVFCSPGIYTIKLMSINDEGQAEWDSVKIEVKEQLENNYLMTMNKDTFNLMLPAAGVKKVNVKIFDKDGALIYKLEEPNGKWDGKNLIGESVEEGIYYFVINEINTLNKKRTIKGAIRLKR